MESSISSSSSSSGAPVLPVLRREYLIIQRNSHQTNSCEKTKNLHGSFKNGQLQPEALHDEGNTCMSITINVAFSDREMYFKDTLVFLWCCRANLLKIVFFFSDLQYLTRKNPITNAQTTPPWCVCVLCVCVHTCNNYITYKVI